MEAFVMAVFWFIVGALAYRAYHSTDCLGTRG